MKITNALIISVALSFMLGGCSIAGPAYPEKNGRAYLEKRGVSGNLVARLIDGDKLDPSEVRDLQTSGSSDVRFLVARNPNLSHQQIAVSIADKDDFTRSGAAQNTNLSSSQIDLLTNDESHTVYSALAGNTALTDQDLLRLREKRDLEGLWFAMNPNCPEIIREAIIASDDSLAKTWLNTTDEWKKAGYYVQDEKGRWYKSFATQSARWMGRVQRQL